MLYVIRKYEKLGNNQPYLSGGCRLFGEINLSKDRAGVLQWTLNTL